MAEDALVQQVLADDDGVVARRHGRHVLEQPVDGLGADEARRVGLEPEAPVGDLDAGRQVAHVRHELRDRLLGLEHRAQVWPL